MLRHRPNPKFEAALLREAMSHVRFRNTQTGEVVVGEFSSTMTSNLRFRGWRNVGRPNDVEDLAKDRLGMRVIHTYDPSHWEEESWRGKGWSKTVNGKRVYEDGACWRKVPRYKTIIAVDNKALAKYGLGTIEQLCIVKALAAALDGMGDW